MVVSRAVLGRSVTVGEAWRDARTQLPRLLGLLVLLPLLITAIVTVGVAPGLLLVATPACRRRACSSPCSADSPRPS